MRNLELTKQRNSKVIRRFDELARKYPQYQTEYIYQMIGNEFFLAARTIMAIVCGEYEKRWGNKIRNYELGIMNQELLKEQSYEQSVC